MGTGVGEAMLIGAAVGATAGGAGAAIQGGDPLKGALTGGAMGAVGGGLGAGFGAAGGAASGAGGGATAGAGAGVGTGATAGTTAGSTFGSLAAPTGATVGAGMGAGTSTFGSLTASQVPSMAGSLGGSAGATGGAGMGLTAGSAGGASAGIPSGLGIAQGSALPAGGYSATGMMPPSVGPGNFTGYAPQLSNMQLGMTAGTAGLAGAMQAERSQFEQPDEEYTGPLSKFKYDPDKFKASNPIYAPNSVYRPTYAAEGGIMQAFQNGGPVERMSMANTAMNPQGGLYPQGMIDKTQYATPTQRPTSMEVVESQPNYSARVNPTTGTLMAKGGIARYDMGGIASAAGVPNIDLQQASLSPNLDQGIAALPGKKRMLTKEQMDAVKMQGMSKEELNDIYGRMAAQGLAAGGHLGGYSDGGRMLKGPGDGMSDNIPATIAGKQPARLADGEFVVPADVVSHLGNGSTDAGAKQLYSMMDRVRKARTGSKKQGKQIKPAKYLAA